MRSDFKLGIVTPTLNSALTIRRTIESVLEQDFDDLDYLIIDGGSTDRTLEILNDYKGLLRIISEKDKGIYYAMNKGVNQSLGNVIGIINSDDWYLPGSFIEVRETYKRTNADIIYSNTQVQDLQGKLGISEHFHEQLPLRMIGHPAVFVTRSSYELLGGFNVSYKIASDYDLLLKAYINGLKFVKTQEPLAAYALGGFSDKPENRIKSIHEVEIIKITNLNTSRFAGLRTFIKKSVKTIYLRDDKLKMTLALFQLTNKFLRNAPTP